jgi:hypothetical protein
MGYFDQADYSRQDKKQVKKILEFSYPIGITT